MVGKSRSVATTSIFTSRPTADKVQTRFEGRYLVESISNDGRTLHGGSVYNVKVGNDGKLSGNPCEV